MTIQYDNNTLLAVIGGGNMGTAIAKGLLQQNWQPQNLLLLEKNPQRAMELRQQFTHSQVIESYAELPRCDICLLAVKPGHMASACETLLSSKRMHPNTLYISIAAGVSLSALHGWLGTDAPIVRCMPNTPASIQMAASALYADANISSRHRQFAEDILSAVGTVLWVECEDQVDIVTAISGSGPAYFFYFMECLYDSAVALGLSAQDSLHLVKQTAAGASQLALLSTTSLSDLRQQVTSKGGTTESALLLLQDHDLKSIVKQAVGAAADRAAQIRQEFK